jgi:hypothetical protein
VENDPRDEERPVEPPAEPVKQEAPPPAPPKKRRFEKLRRFGAFMHEHYFHMDPRTAGFFRIVLGFLCATDAMRHWWVADRFYSNEGVLTNHWHLFKPSSGHNFSVYHAFSTLPEVHLAFALSVFCHLCLMVGWHARLFSIIAFILVTSLDNRLVMVENGGYVVVNLVAMYAMFLPIDRRYSVDAWRRSMRERKEKSAADLNQRYLPSWAKDDFVSAGAFLVVLNLAVVYFFNVVNKGGWTWRLGETVHYVLYLNRMVTGIAVFFRKIVPMPVTRGLTWYVLCHEAMLVPLILWPYGRRVTRTLAVFGVWTLHLVFGTMFRLGPFAWFMIGWSFTLPTAEQWNLLESFYRKRSAARTVVYDRNSPLAFFLMRVLSRANGMDLLRFEESREGDPSPALFLARDDASGSVYTGREALREVAQALPGGKYAFPILGLFAAPLFTYASARRESLARFFGLTLPPAGEDEIDTPSPLRASLLRRVGHAREAFFAYFTVIAVLQAVEENKAFPAWAKPKKYLPQFAVKVMDASIGYPRLYQGWGMFAPNPIKDDGVITVDAMTSDSRHVDPFTGKEPDLDLTDSEGEALGQIQQDYFNRIRLDRNKVFRQGLQEWILRYPQRTGKPEDEIIAYDVYWVRAWCPKPGGDKPYNNETIAIMSWRKPGYRPKPGQPALPPEPKVESADTPQNDTPEIKRFFGYKLPDFMQ